MEQRKIKELRIHLELSQERFAQLLGVSMQTVRRWESGLAKPLPIIALKLEELQKKINDSLPGKDTMKEKPKKPPEGIDIDIGLGGLFKGFSGLFELASKMAEEGKHEETRTVEKEILGGKGKALYGFSVRVGVGGKPVINSFGNVRATADGPVVAEVREPIVDVIDEGSEMLVTAEIPGVEEKDIKIEVKDDVLTVSAESRDRKYYKEVLLSSPVLPEALTRSYRNGVLEVKFKKITNNQDTNTKE